MVASAAAMVVARELLVTSRQLHHRAAGVVVGLCIVAHRRGKEGKHGGKDRLTMHLQFTNCPNATTKQPKT